MERAMGVSWSKVAAITVIRSVAIAATPARGQPVPIRSLDDFNKALQGAWTATVGPFPNPDVAQQLMAQALERGRAHVPL